MKQLMDEITDEFLMVADFIALLLLLVFFPLWIIPFLFRKLKAR